MSTVRWRPIAEKPISEREMTAMIKCTDIEDSFLLPGPVRWDGGEWVSEETGRGIRYEPGATYHWCAEADLV